MSSSSNFSKPLKIANDDPYHPVISPNLERILWFVAMVAMLYLPSVESWTLPVIIIGSLALAGMFANPITLAVRYVRKYGYRQAFYRTWKPALMISAFAATAIATGALIAWSV